MVLPACIVRHLLARYDPRAAILDREGEVIEAPRGAPPIDGRSFAGALAELDGGSPSVVVGSSPDRAERWRLEPIHDDERVAAVLVAPDEDEPPLAETELVSLVADELADLSETAIIFISFVDTERRYRFVNRSYSRWFDPGDGLPLVGRHVREVLGEEVYREVEPMIDRVLAGETAEIDLDREIHDVGVKHVRVRYIPSRDARGQVRGFYVLAFDKTPHTQIQRALAESEARFQEIVEHLDEVVWTVEGEFPNLKQLYLSPSFERVFGWPVELTFATPRAWLQTVVEEDRERVVDGLQDFHRELEFRVRRPDGTLRWLNVKRYPVMDEEGRLLRRVGTATDITARKEIELELRASEERFRLALENVPVFVSNQDRELRYTWTSRDESGLAQGVLLGKRDADLLARPDDVETITALKRRVLDTGKGIHEEVAIHVGGKRMILDLMIEPLRDASGEIVGITSASTNITQKHAAAAARREELERLVAERTEAVVKSEARLRAVLEAASELIISIDEGGTIDSCNRAIVELLGYTPEEVLGRNVSMLMPEPHRGQHDRYLQRYDLTGVMRLIGRPRELSARAKDGTEVPVRIQIAQTMVDGQRMYVGVLQDRRPEERAQEALRYRAALVDNMTNAVVSTDLGMRIVTWGGGAEAIYGWAADEVVGRRVSEVLASKLEGEHDVAQQQLFEEGSWRGEATQRRKDGSSVVVSSHVSLVRDASGHPTGVIAVNADITAIKDLQAQYAHMQKMEALGRLTAGIAHDFGNLLMGISGCATLALSQVSEESAAARSLRALIEATRRGAGLSRQLMTFSRKKGELRDEVLSLDAVVFTTRSLLDRLIGDDIELVTELACSRGHLRADASRLEQILVNLIINAVDAMPKGGTITIATSEVDVMPHDAERRGLPVSGPHVRLRVTDTGQGMDDATMERLFEPFFTTKPVGEGTGLGLSTVYAFTKEMGGGLEVHSVVGQGTSFSLYFPRTEPDLAEPDPHQTLPRGTEAVLLVEDESLVRLTVRHYLESLGYTVLEATSPYDALRMCGNASERIDLLLSDVVMPEIGGRECARRARALRPELHVLFMSAHPEEHLLARGSLRPGDEVLHKPFSRAELAAAIRRTLEAPTTKTAGEPPPRRGGRVLVVDDAELTLISTSDFLRGAGHHTFMAATAADALACVDREDIELVLADLTLPDMIGTELVREIRSRRPTTAIIYMSGFSREHAEVGPEEIWFQKPIELNALLDAIDAQLRRREG
ncbi:MAG: PAS domain S-box protein [Myxococcales bacterium]|nr:PAS domain S-box protein [Myxococcales bacterium]